MWVIQNNLNFEVGIDNIKQILKSKNIEVVEVDIYKGDENIYFKDTRTLFNPISKNDIFVLGSYRLSRMATEKGFFPGCFSNDNFNYDCWTKNWTSEMMLNGHFLIQKITDIEIPAEWDSVFARPFEDDKLITGGLYRKEDLLIALSNKITDQNKEKSIIIAEKKTILAEYRFFIIDNEVVTGSLYKIRGQVVSSDVIDSVALAFAQERVKQWTPSRAFVLDIALTDSGPKIIEVNNISSAGLYKADVEKIVNSMESLMHGSIMNNNLSL
jgi:hypothetical protein